MTGEYLMKAKKLLAIISLQERDKTRKIISELKNCGRTKKELDLATKIANCLSYFSNSFFEKPIPIYFVTKGKENNHNLAAYCHPSMMAGLKEECFFIYLKGLSAKFNDCKNYCRTNYSFSIDNKCHKFEMTDEEFLISIGAHEVRHRLQYNGRVKLFDTDKKYRKPLCYLIAYHEDVCKHQKQIYEREGESPEFIAWDLSREEFDADIVQDVFSYKLHRGRSLKELCETLKMER